MASLPKSDARSHGEGLLGQLRALTPARVGLGRVGAALPTDALLDFMLDHARARDAVHANFKSSAIAEDIGVLGAPTFQVSSRAQRREDYLRRPDLGRKLDAESRERL